MVAFIKALLFWNQLQKANQNMHKIETKLLASKKVPSWCNFLHFILLQQRRHSLGKFPTFCVEIREKSRRESKRGEPSSVCHECFTNLPYISQGCWCFQFSWYIVLYSLRKCCLGRQNVEYNICKFCRYFY